MAAVEVEARSDPALGVDVGADPAPRQADVVLDALVPAEREGVARLLGPGASSRSDREQEGGGEEPAPQLQNATSKFDWNTTPVPPTAYGYAMPPTGERLR